MPETLDSAAARLRSTIRLNRKLSLILLVGPPFRAEEALPALGARLDPDRPLLSHRFDVDGERLEAATERAGPGGPFVLAYGLEYVPTTALVGLLVGLNFRRDRLAPRPATVLMWLPHNRKEDFFHHCQDFFDWRERMLELSLPEPNPAEAERVAWRALLVDILNSTLPRPLRLSVLQEEVTLQVPDVPLELKPDETSPPLDFDTWADQTRQGVVIAPPGTGKSAARARYAHRLARAALVEQATGRALLRVHSTKLAMDKALPDALLAGAQPDLAPYQPWLPGWAEAGRLILCVDSADALPRDQQRHLWSRLKAWREALPKMSILVTARPDVLLPPEGWSKAQAQAWSEADALRYLRTRGLDDRALDRLSGHGGLLATPLLAELTAHAWQSRHGKLPDEKMAVLDLALSLPADPALDSLAPALLDGREHGFGLRQIAQDSPALRAMIRLSLVRVEDNKILFNWYFMISYLAARHLSSSLREALLDRWARSSADPAWEDALRMAVGRYARALDPTLLADLDLPEPPEPEADENDWLVGLAQHALALEAALAAGTAPATEAAAPLTRRAQELLGALDQRPAPRHTHKLSAAAGRLRAALARLPSDEIRALRPPARFLGPHDLRIDWTPRPARDRMTPAARRQLGLSLRDLHDRLIDDLRSSARRSWRLTNPWPSEPTEDAIQRWRAELGASERGAYARGEIEHWLATKARDEGVAARELPAWRDRCLDGLFREAAYTLLHRLAFLRILEVNELQPKVLTGGWENFRFRDLRTLAPGLARRDPSEGFDFLLRMVFEELAQDLPGLYGDQELHELIDVPPATLHNLIEALNDRGLDSCWRDDTTPGWMYQYWNDPDREALDARLNRGGKIENDEIASKTQLFTERYLVEWLLQNTLGPLWLGICQRQGWTAEVMAAGTLDALEQRRAAWREAVATGEIPPDRALPIDSPLEERWKYLLRQPLPQDGPKSVAELRLLDPAVGSGHFLVAAFDLLFAMYEEEARHRDVVGQPGWTAADIAASIVENNLHGLDLDPRAVQIAAAALWVKARRAAPGVQIGRMNLVASNLGLGALSEEARAALQRELSEEAGLPAALTDRILRALSEADHLGTLLKVDQAVEDALRDWERGGAAPRQQSLLEQRKDWRRKTVTEALGRFLARHAGDEDLGLRLHGAQLAKGVRFLAINKEKHYHVVVGNPPYQGAQKLGDAGIRAYLERCYPEGKHDLYAAFLLRSLELAAPGGLSALITMRGWMFIQQYAALRAKLLEEADLRALGDVDRGAFEEIGGAVVAAVMTVFRRAPPSDVPSVAVRATKPEDIGGAGITDRKRAGLLGQAEVFTPSVTDFRSLPGIPILYSWSHERYSQYHHAAKLGDSANVKKGLITSHDGRFFRYCWEPIHNDLWYTRHFGSMCNGKHAWVPIVRGAKGRAWIDPSYEVIKWRDLGLEVKVYNEWLYKSYTRQIMNEHYYGSQGVAFATIGATFSARIHRFASILHSKGASAFGLNPTNMLCQMNKAIARDCLESLNPGVDFTVGDVNRLPLFPVESADQIVATLDQVFTEHESHRETSIEFRAPGPSAWQSAQAWAQRMVDRPAGAPLEAFQPTATDPPLTDLVSYAFGVAMGRFHPDGRGPVDPSTDDLSAALPHGVLFLVPDGVPEEQSNLNHPAAAPLRAAWAAHGPAIAPRTRLAAWLRERFFTDVHRPQYEGRPIYWPLSSASRSFVAWVQLHRLTPDTLAVVLGDHVRPTLTRLEGLRADLLSARLLGEKARARAAERDLGRLTKLSDELKAFESTLREVLERGAPPASDKAPRRERDARWAPALDDGVRVQCAALWPLLAPQWKDPQKWWAGLCADTPKNDDWSQTAARYFPARVARRCKEDPSLAVAHGCFWALHPALAFKWEQRLARQLGPDFRIDEPGAEATRAAFLAEHPDLQPDDDPPEAELGDEGDDAEVEQQEDP